MEEFTIMLNNVPDSYYGFIVGVLSYVKTKQGRLEKVKTFMEEHKNASASDIVEFISNQEDAYEDTVHSHKQVC